MSENGLIFLSANGDSNDDAPISAHSDQLKQRSTKPMPVKTVVQTYTTEDLSSLSERAAAAARRRTHLNVHPTPDANVQRLFIATEPDTYMRPHRHPEPHKWEFLAVLRGRLALLVFDDAGELRQRIAMSSDATLAVEIAPNTFHAYVCLQAGTIALEIKEGAYIPTPEHEFAPWSPAERSPEAHAYLTWMRSAEPSVR